MKKQRTDFTPRAERIADIPHGNLLIGREIDTGRIRHSYPFVLLTDAQAIAKLRNNSGEWGSDIEWSGEAWE
jgi:hypothetical protein